jgi:hypothetical protein
MTGDVNYASLVQLRWYSETVTTDEDENSRMKALAGVEASRSIQRAQKDH